VSGGDYGDDSRNVSPFSGPYGSPVTRAVIVDHGDRSDDLEVKDDEFGSPSSQVDADGMADSGAFLSLCVRCKGWCVCAPACRVMSYRVGAGALLFQSRLT
jgi:hypothetical protein